jgi:hypothetical protein
MLDPPSPSPKWLGNDNSGIAAWAAEIPPNAPPTVEDISAPPEHFRMQRTQTPYRTYRTPPNLLKSSRRIAPPCLSVATTLPSHSSPRVTPPSPKSSAEPPAPTNKNPGLSKTSSKSAQTESTVSTPSSSQHQPSVPIFCPSRKSSILGDMYIHVRSWVSPSPAMLDPVEIPHQKRQPLAVHKMVSSSKFVTLTTRPPPPKKSLACENYLGRGRRLPELAFNDEPPSFRARGRKASRAAA